VRPAVGALLPLAIIALAVAWADARTVPWGFNLTDATVQFHFGHRVAGGQMPYRDFIYQTGPFTVYWEAAFQALMGPRLWSSLAAGIAVRVLTAWLLFACLRRRVGVACAATVSAATVLLIPGHDHRSYDDAAMFALALAACALAAARPRCRPLALTLGGTALAMIVATRQANALVTLAVTAGALVAARFLWSPRHRPRGLAWFLAGFLLVAAGWAAAFFWRGALSAAWTQLVLESGQKKPMPRLTMIVNALLGGWNMIGRVPTFTANAAPILLAALPLAVASIFRRPLATGWRAILVLGSLTLACAALAATSHPGSAAGSWVQGLCHWVYYDLPRSLYSLALVLVLLWPGASARLCRVPPFCLLLVAAAVLGETWGEHLSWLGPKFVSHLEPAGLVLLLLLVGSRATAPRLWNLCAAVLTSAAIAVTIFTTRTLRASGGQPQPPAAQAAADPVAYAVAGIAVTPAKMALLHALAGRVNPGDSLFIYGGAPALYSLLRTVNDTNLDMVYPDFMSVRDARAAAAALRAHPPRWLIACFGPSFQGPWSETNPLNIPLVAGADRFGFNEPAAALLHEEVVHLARDYDLVYSACPSPGLESDRDHAQQIRLYRRRGD
jgi:hypothetical protein